MPMTFWLAPMEGLMDFSLREIVSRYGHIDLAVSEFVRVVDLPLPESVFLAQVPELAHGGITKYGTPIRVQLLGSDPEALLANAKTALAMGSHGVDFNFGCPSKTVNRHCGGAALLKEPDRIYNILHHIKSNLPANTSLSAKMRLGFDDTSKSLDVALAVAYAGFDTLVVHGRTKRQGYKPPADWEAIGKIKQAVRIKVIANGDIFTQDAYRRCLEVTGCTDVMIGRGAVYQPNLIAQLAHGDKPLTWQEILQLLLDYQNLMHFDGFPERHIPGRVKQWVKLLGAAHEQGAELFSDLKHLQDLNSVKKHIQNELSQYPIHSMLR